MCIAISIATNNNHSTIKANPPPQLLLTPPSSSSSLVELEAVAVVVAEPLTPKNKVEQGAAEATTRRRNLLFNFGRSSCSLTQDETTAESETETETEPEEEEEEERIQLITRPRGRRSSAPLACPPQRYASQLVQASRDPTQTSLVLRDFVERSTRHDVYALRDLLVQEDRRPWTTLRFEDTCPTVGFRRWAYKKDNIQHHIQQLCLDRNIPLEFHSRIQIRVDDGNNSNTTQSALPLLLQEIKKHPEIRSLEIVGRLNLQQETLLLKEVTSLLRLNDRDWDAVNIHTGFVASSTNGEEEEYEAWRQLMVHYMGTVFSQLYTKYNLPIDVRPCASD